MSARRSFGSITAMPDGSYRGRYRVQGRDYYTPRRPTRRAVQADLTRAEAGILAGTWTPPTPRRARKAARPTAGGGPLFVDELARQWIAGLIAEGRSPNTLRSYRSHLRRYISPAIGRRRVRDLTEADLLAVLARTDGLARRTRTNAMLALSSLLAAAPPEERPTPALKVPRVPGRVEPTTRRALTAAELGSLVAATVEPLRAAVALAGWCSLRSGEISGLRRGDVDVGAWTVRVRRAVKRDEKGRPVVGPPKSVAGYRTVSIPPQAREVVTAHLAGEGCADEPLFPGSWGGFLSDRVLRRAVRLGAEAAGIEPVTVHELRHTGLTLYGQAGATLADLMARAGHTSAETVMIYQHSSAVRDRELAARMGG